MKREMDEKERSKERGSKSALFLRIYVFSFLRILTSKHRLIHNHDINIHNDQSDNSDATFYITSNRRGVETEMCQSARTQTPIALLPALTTQ